MIPGDAIVVTLSLAGFAAIIYGPWQSACVDLIRQPLFEQRDRLFRMATEGRISFDDPAYKTVRASINLLIRYAHLVSFPRFAAHFILGSVKSAPASDTTKAVASVTDQVVLTELTEIRSICAMSMIQLVVIKSPMLWLVSLLAVPIYGLIKLFGASASVAKAFVGATMAQIYEDAEVADRSGLIA